MSTKEAECHEQHAMRKTTVCIVFITFTFTAIQKQENRWQIICQSYPVCQSTMVFKTLWQKLIWNASVQKLLAEMALPSRRPNKQWSWQSTRPKVYMLMVGAQKKLPCTRPIEQKFSDLLWLVVLLGSSMRTFIKEGSYHHFC